MKQYKEHLKAILAKGTHKPAARENMPGTTSLFGYQWRHDLSEGFPLLTTKKTSFKNIVVELLWFLKGDTNIKYLIDNGCNIWNEDSYNFYLKDRKRKGLNSLPFEEYIRQIKDSGKLLDYGFTLGDCGFQYGRVWRKWQSIDDTEMRLSYWHVDQIAKLIKQLKNSPESRRHILTSIDPANDENLALYWCHALTQFNCRPIKYHNTHKLLEQYDLRSSEVDSKVKELNLPLYYLDCQMYQRSADSFLGIPYNIASYALLTHIIAKICNMEPGEMIYSYGDSHIYDNHIDQVKEQLTREERPLPTVIIDKNNSFGWKDKDWITIFDYITPEFFQVENYNPHPPIKGELSTGLIK